MGKPGSYSMMQFDKNYKITEFPEKISEQILSFTKTLTEWNAGKNEKGDQIDTYRFLSYKIRNGQVVEIFP